MIQDMTQGTPWKLILRFSVPLIIGNIFQQLYNMVDSIIVGQFVGKHALAAVGISFTVVHIVVGLAMGLGIGISIMIGQYFGGGMHRELRETIATAHYMILISSAVVTLLMFVFARPLLHLINVDALLMPDTLQYVRIMAGGAVFTMTYNIYTAMLRAVGDSRTPLIFLIVSAASNVVLDLLFVPVLGMGVAGAAIATLLAQALSCVLCIVYVQRKVEVLHFGREDLGFNRVMFGKMLKLSVPTALQQTILSSGMIALQGIVNQFSTDVVAAYSAVAKIDSLAITPNLAINVAMPTFVAQNAGAHKFDRITQAAKSMTVVTVSIGIVMAVGMVLFGPQIVMAFVDPSETEVIRMGAEYLSITSLAYPVFGILCVHMGCLRGAGDVLITALSSTVELLFRVFIATLLTSSLFTLGYAGIWWCKPIGWVVNTTFIVCRFWFGPWRKKVITKARDREPGAPDTIEGEASS